MWEDLIAQYYPGVTYFAVAVAEGRFPLWFPGVRCGMPFYTDIQLGVCNPLNWLLPFCVRDGQLPFQVYQAFVVAHYALGGLFLYALLRSYRLSAPASLIGAVTFVFSGFLSLRIVNYVMVQVFIWVPLALLFAREYDQQPRNRHLAGLVAVLLLMLLAGHPQTTLYGWYFVAVYWLVVHCRRGQVWRETGRLAAVFGIVIVLGLFLIWPVMENWWHTGRRQMGPSSAMELSAPPHNFIRLVAPNYFGVAAGWGARIKGVPFWGENADATPDDQPAYWQYWEFGLYAGQAGLMAVLGLLAWRGGRHRPTALFFLAAWLVGLWWMLGRHGGLFWVVERALPGVALFRGPSKMAGVVDLSAAVLLAFFVDELRVGPARRKLGLVIGGLLAVIGGLWVATNSLPEPTRREFALRAVVTAAGWTVVIGGICWGLATCRSARGQWGWLTALFVLVWCDVSQAHRFFHAGRLSPQKMFAVPPQLLRAEAGRVAQVNNARLVVDNTPFIRPELEMLDGYTPFFLSTTAAFLEGTNTAAVWDIANVRYVLDGANPQPPTARPTALPRAKWYGVAQAFPDLSTLQRAVTEGAVDYHREAAVLTRDLPPLHGAAGSAEWRTTDRPEEQVITYQAEGPGIIFVSEAFYPGWETDTGWPVIRVFGAFKGIVVPAAGSGEVRLRFRPKPLRYGSLISIAGLMGLSGWLTWRQRKTAANLA